jgi:hypothetical protein
MATRRPFMDTAHPYSVYSTLKTVLISRSSTAKHSPVAANQRYAFRDEVVAASPTRVFIKTSRGTRRLSRAIWTIAPIEGETRMPEYVPALLKELAARERQPG